jgi:hypothetical protein
MERTGWSGMESSLLKNAFRNSSAILTTPSAPLRWLRIFLLMAQPPLLYQEGSYEPQIHSHLHPRPEFDVPQLRGVFFMRSEVLEESIRAAIEEQAERFGVNYYDLSTNVQSWLRSLVMQQLYNKDTEPTVSPETGDEE